MEKDKFYYYALAYKNQTDVVIVKSPSNNNENKKFLGYEWSNAKGNEGIHYITKSAIKVKDESLEEEDKRILENLQGLKHINTPLYNPEDLEDESKINKIIRDNFKNIKATIPIELEAFVSRARLVDMLDFNRVDFNKALSLTASKKVEIESKWEIVKLDDVVELHDTLRKPIKESDRRNGTVPYYGATGIIDYIDGYTHDGIFLLLGEDGAKWEENENSSFIVEGKFWANNHVHVLKVSDMIKDIYLREFLNQTDLTIEYITGLTVKKLNQRNLLNIKIPLPPLEIQEQIVKECQKVDDEVVEANEIIEQSKTNIILTMNSSNENTIMKLGETCKLKAGKFVSAKDIHNEDGKNLYPCYGGNGLRGYTKTFTHEGVYPLIGRQGALCGNITLVHGKFHATEHALAVTPKLDLDVIWLTNKLIMMDLNQYKTGTAQPGLSVKNINVVNIEIPPLETQKQIVAKIEILESNINDAQKIIDEAQHQKETILKKYL
ncbi:MAG: Type I restriction-modification system, specificity subunit S (EC [uncultured Sulfurovum sp.]|uniref:Type I restriction-modification system, specificity subunit S (EC) n=1 Tax=uncultured Sulfurovum sp. TaxID=269237 RepID=A0A6S6SNR8_9BACT|nr:MAG: Type I restriction-modification system, specificity subunit S (EC [uncultured Sulfurovum sp.]